ncbi:MULTISPECIES: TonB-dependent receptor [Shewanella]|jgi:iron complex outermembrane receptor protein|uniref:TonB-dependent receptor n=2 Tax=Shewanellaceae TaxID=267890 RepID=UPI001673B7F9|nr:MULTISPECIES: TonB-dependent receptor [Shewanella]MBO1272616.1 TonB-dependent receptor [Shewanella sp. 4t3-1-2LB]MCL2905428.1 TonB-dependent receptor [Shewanella fodinae]GGY90985.1 TonB-dependent receptor [Shewanella fodinae]
MLKTNKIASAVRLSLIAAVSAGSFGVVHAAPAADKSAAKTSDVERIEVTGSRIKRQDMESASPVTSISADTIVAQGYASVDQLLQDQTSMAGAPIGSTTNNGADGIAQVDLRGMGANRTLVLLNGRRMVNSGSGADSAVDLNAIPVAMIQRVEILKDGASAVYGSDAIAGVVNIITKKDFEGFQFDAKSSSTDKGDGQTYELNALYGFNTNNGGNYTVGAAYSKRNGVIQADRDWTENGSSSFVPEGALWGDGIKAGKVVDANGNWIDRTYGYDYTKDSYYQTPSKRYSVFANMTQELGNDLVLTGDLLYTKRKSHQQMAAQPADIMLDVCNATKTENCITLDSAMTAAGITAFDDGTVEYRRRTNDVGPRIYTQDTDTYRASLGLQGYLEAGNGLNWDVSYTYGKNKATTGTENSINATWMANSIYANQDAWFYGGSIPAEDIDAISYMETNHGGNEQHDVQANLSGDLFQLSAGAVSFAFGAEYRYEEGYYTPDPIIVAGDSTAAQQDPTKGHYDVISFFQEVSVPFTEKLTGDFAWRYDEYDTFGKASTWKVGLTYRVTEDLMLRGVVATGFRAPNISELFGGNSGSYDYLDDPWGNALDAQLLVNRTSDKNLKPEESESYTAGIVYSPSFLDGFSTTIDYWKFNITDAISRVDVQANLDACHDGDAAACAVINVTADGDLTNLTAALTNVGKVQTSGVDINVAYKFSGLGLDWSINNDATYLIKHIEDGIDYSDYVDGNMGGYAKWRNNFTITAGQDAWNVMYYNRYISSMRDYNLNDGSKADSVLYHNIVGTYHLTDSLSLSAGVKNFTDEKPSYVSNGSDGGTSPQVYDVVGRQIYGSVSYKF